MSYVTLRNGRRVGDYLEPYIIAELNTSHFGEVPTAKRMIDEAKAAGCDCVKFQSWTADTLYSEAYYRKNRIAKRMVSSFSLSEEQLLELAMYASSVGVDFASTPYSIEEARFLVESCDVPFIKIASMELNNLPYLTQLGETGCPLVLSTGMGTIEEIAEAIETIKVTGNNSLVVLHCTSVYPSPPELIRLRNITGLRIEFPNIPVGFSDHSIGIDIPVSAVALGACVIEKHFTLDRTRIGMDNQMATEPAQLIEMVTSCRRVHRAMGGGARILDTQEISMATKMRRSIIARESIGAGQKIQKSLIDFKRPGDGIPPSKTELILGKLAIRDIAAGEAITQADVE